MTDPAHEFDLFQLAQAALSRQNTITVQGIRDVVQGLRVLRSDLSDEEVEKIARQLESIHDVYMGESSALVEADYKPWLENAKSEIDPYYWSRYKKLLAVEKSLSSKVILRIDEVTDRITGLLQNPSEPGPWDRRGMVVGHVQSGKTANYIGVMAKAADAGYRIIIVIAGLHNNLRNQTQMRIDEGFIGWESAGSNRGAQSRRVGVGAFDSTRRPWCFTSAVRDFNKNTANSVGGDLSDLKEPAVFVIKKNPNTLKNLTSWLLEKQSGSGKQKLPMLLIDDEADNASINISYSKEEVSRINGQIRELLSRFERSCFIGYTATPFANIFIDPDTEDEMVGQDLFPRDFIVSLDPPSNYVSPERIFDVPRSDSIVRYVEDNEDVLPRKHKKEFRVEALPRSLHKAIRVYVLARAIRILRGDGAEHCTMMVNGSVFVNVQMQIRELVAETLSCVQDSVRLYSKCTGAAADPELATLRDTWHDEFEGQVEFSWKEILSTLNEAAAGIAVIAVNGKSTTTLQYEDYREGRAVVAVGGFSLSRGLTLEGLVVSYFLRNSQAYDTLMQMGRWFGYRDGYVDLCRIWMPEDTEGWYAHIAESVELLREEFRRMEAEKATPSDFGLKVRSHPDTLLVTARNKMGAGEQVAVEIGLANSFIETATLLPDAENLQKNRKAAARLATQLAEKHENVRPRSLGSGAFFTGVEVGQVLEFLAEYQNHPGALLTDPLPVRRYIAAREADELRLWDVLFFGKNDSKDALRVYDCGFEIICQQRRVGIRSDERTIRVTNKSRVSSRGVERFGLEDAEIRAAEKAYTREVPPGEAVNYPDRIYRNVRKKPLLIVHLLELVELPPELAHVRPPVVAWSMSLPRTEHEEKKVKYVVNQTWLAEQAYFDFDEEDTDE